jgi:general secretion pathway protein D
MRLRFAVPVTLFMLLAPAAYADPAEATAPVDDQPIYHCQKKVESVAITFKPEVDLKELTAWAVGFTCKNFTWEPRVIASGKKVTLIVPNKLTPGEAYRVFLGALSTMGLTVVPKGSVLEVVDESRAKRSTVPMLHDETGEQVVRTVYRPEHAQADIVAKAMEVAKSDAGEIASAGTLLLITDYASHLRDMLAIARLVDVEGGSDAIYTIPLLHADGQEVAKVIEGLAATGGKEPAPTKVMVDARTNTLILAGSEPAYRRAAALAQRLDADVGADSGSTMRVYQLASAIADDVAKTLNAAVQDQQPQGQPGRPGQPAVALEGKVKVIADVATNKLLITSSARDFYALRDVIRELDQPRRQIYIEAMIMEVQLGNSVQGGVSAHGGYEAKDGTPLFFGGVQTAQLSSTNTSSLASLAGLLGGIVGAPLSNSQSLLGTSIPSYGVLFQALASNGKTEILSKPTFIALDNVETKFKVGTNVPYERGVSYNGVTGGALPPGAAQKQIERIDLLLELDVTPHISGGDTVQLAIKHESKDLGDKEELGITWTVRGFETGVVVHDQQTAMIGGILQQRVYDTEQKVPILGDVPLLGYLFKYKTKIKKKSNLVILLTPYILHDSLDVEMIRQRKLREYDEFSSSMRVLDHAELEPKIDYRRKRGLVEEINRNVQSVEEDIAARGAITPPKTPEGGVIK